MTGSMQPTPAPRLKKISHAGWQHLPEIRERLQHGFAEQPAEARIWMREIEDNISGTVVCEIDGQLAGFAGLHFIDEHVCVLWHHFVHEPLRGQGIGSLLVFASLLMAGVGEVPLEAGVVTPPDTEGFYLRLGFASEGDPVFDPILNQPVCRLHRSFSPEDLDQIHAALESREDIQLFADDVPEGLFED